jgi:hypothetical protein
MKMMRAFVPGHAGGNWFSSGVGSARMRGRTATKMPVSTCKNSGLEMMTKKNSHRKYQGMIRTASFRVMFVHSTMVKESAVLIGTL